MEEEQRELERLEAELARKKKLLEQSQVSGIRREHARTPTHSRIHIHTRTHITHHSP